MRLALLGQIGPHRRAIQSMAEFCLETLRVPRVVYLGDDDAFDAAISEWAERIAGCSGFRSFWTRSLKCVNASADAIEQFLDAERLLRKLEALETLASEPASYSIVHVGRYPVLLCHQAENIELGAPWPRVVVQGVNAEPTLNASASIPPPPSSVTPPPANAPAVGLPQASDRRTAPEACVHLAPGNLEQAGLMVLECETDRLWAHWYDRDCQKLATRELSLELGLARDATAD